MAATLRAVAVRRYQSLLTIAYGLPLIAATLRAVAAQRYQSLLTIAYGLPLMAAPFGPWLRDVKNRS
jgi:hypothetical protein